MKCLAVIPARGGSKRIPKKNIRDFLGKPIISYSIDAAFKSGLFDEVIVSTDDQEIAELAKKHGANVPFMRSLETSDDYATLADVIEEVKECYIASNKQFDYICCMLATAPLLRISDLKKGFEMLVKENADSVRPVVKFDYPVQRALKLNDKKIEMFNEEYLRTRSQDLEPAYYDAAQFYWMKFDKGLEGSCRLGFEISRLYTQDIDDEEDWNMAEIKYQALK